MASNPHSDFTTHNRTLPTLSNLPIFATVAGGFCGGSVVYVEVLGAEHQGWGRGARPVVAGSMLAVGYSFSSVGRHGDMDGLWYL